MIFDEDGEEQFDGFTCAEAEEIEREFEEDDSECEDSASGDVSLNVLHGQTEVEVPAFTDRWARQFICHAPHQHLIISSSF